MHATEWLALFGDDRTVGERNAHVDSFLVHSRRILDILTKNTRAEPDDVLVVDLVDSPPHIALPTVSDQRDLINKRILHVTTDAEPFTVEWPIKAIASEFENALQLLIDQMVEEGVQEVDRLFQAKEGHGGFRKVIKN